ncbi:hypothetical protein BESB_052380 [Besnoitia besnoiti]|uniref:Uncharacterized protein n=1 Tax=Besnoitia besnoiti TaxID=94643 RepID=A0A2A9MJ18_BESBE|nr:hypothetical protein BESB_052380 [Besnoitia besnoiti]PFH35587.1 hypothetical protein BESB_052380 [Besnoitia besnoiti]
MGNLMTVVCLLLCLGTTVFPLSEASRLTGRAAYPIEEDQAEATEAADEGLVAGKDKAASHPYDVESTGSEDEEEAREADIDEAEEQYLEKKEEVAGKSSKKLRKPLSPEEARKMLKTYGESLESVINSVVSAHAGVRDLLGTESRKGKA